MKRIVTALAAVAALLLAGCATNYDKYAEAQQAIVKAQSEAETARLAALAAIAETGDVTTRTAAVMALALTGNRGGITQMAPPQNEALEWARIIVPSAAHAYTGYLAAGTQRLSIEANTVMHGQTLGTLGAVASQGIDAAGEVVFPPVYTVPMGSAHAAPAAAVAAP